MNQKREEKRNRKETKKLFEFITKSKKNSTKENMSNLYVYTFNV